MIKAIFFDIDGTLLSHTLKAVPESTRAALKMLSEKHIDRVVASGRHMQELAGLPVSDIDFDAYITLNGQLCFDREGKLFFANPFTDMEEVLRIFGEKQIPVMLVEQDDMYMNFVNDRVIETQNSISTPVPRVGEYTGRPVYQALFYVNRDEEPALAAMLPGYDLTRWNPNAVDIVAKGGSKVTGIEAYLRYKGYEVSETAAFGDGENDTEMLEFVGTGIAMGNALDSVKAAADCITADVDHDGIAKGIEYLMK